MIWSDLVQVQVPLVEKVLRTVLVYGGLVLLLRLAAKRDLAQLNSFDLGGAAAALERGQERGHR